MTQCKTLVLSSCASNQGKTLVTASLAYHLKSHGHRVRVFKTGPDYIDPTILERASGNTVYQLDLWMVGEEQCRELLNEAAMHADFILVEGVMGLFDGEPSTADLAKTFGLPVVGVINAQSLAQTIHAVSYGLANFDTDLHYAGTVANCVASVRHAEMIEKSSLRRPEIPFLGNIMRRDEATLPSRHLGLVTANELHDLDKALCCGAEEVAKTKLEHAAIDVYYPQPASTTTRPEPLLKNFSIAVARDDAFAFVYNANVDWLRRMGAQVTFFSPLKDTSIPEADCIYLPGGYPELHLKKLAGNEQMNLCIKRHHSKGKHIYAECGGMMYLLTEICGTDGRAEPGLDILSGTSVMQKKLQSLGYQELKVSKGSLRGHTFHYSTSELSVQPYTFARRPLDQSKSEAIYRTDGVYASYVHFYFESNPAAAVALLTGQDLELN